MKLVSIGEGKFQAQVDDEDFPKVAIHHWWAHRGVSGLVYARAKIGDAFIYMHRLLLQTPAKMHTDHRNGNGLDNRRENLRVASPKQNGWNGKTRKNNTSGIPGVSWNRQAKRWEAYIRAGRKSHIYLGRFGTIEEAAVAREQAVKQYHGEFGRHPNGDFQSPSV